MSSFQTPHYMYLFEMSNGKKKLAYGASPDDAFEILRSRLPDKELALIDRTKHVRISQREMRKHIHELG